MKTLVLILTLVTGSLAYAGPNTIRYGRDLCDVVSFGNPTQRACEDWVIDHSDYNVYSVALTVCVDFREGPASRMSDCFYRASRWIKSQELKDQADLCEARNGNYVPRAECLRRLFFLKNVQASRATGPQGGQPEGNTGAVK